MNKLVSAHMPLTFNFAIPTLVIVTVTVLPANSRCGATKIWPHVVCDQAKELNEEYPPNGCYKQKMSTSKQQKLNLY